jgi:hypothetical protein
VRHPLLCAPILAFYALACTARPPAAVRGIELEEPEQQARREAAPAGAASESEAALVASGTEPTAAEDEGFVYSRERVGQGPPAVAAYPIHIHESWWEFRARRLGLTVAEAQRRDARLSRSRPPRDFWDGQTATEAVSVWTVLCNECHGGRRDLEDAIDMPAPAPAWGDGEGLFFGNRRSYEHVFNRVLNGGPIKERGRPEMPAWRNILSIEMIWALLYFLEYQSGGIEGGFPPSLYPRRPKVLDEP